MVSIISVLRMKATIVIGNDWGYDLCFLCVFFTYIFHFLSFLQILSYTQLYLFQIQFIKLFLIIVLYTHMCVCLNIHICICKLISTACLVCVMLLVCCKECSFGMQCTGEAYFSYSQNSLVACGSFWALQINNLFIYCMYWN